MTNKNNFKYLLIPIFLEFFSIFNCQLAIAQERRTVKDYYFNLPDSYIRMTPGGRKMNRAERSQILERGGTN